MAAEPAAVGRGGGWLAPALVCVVLFVDVPVPVFGTVLKAALLPVALLLLLGRQTVAPWMLGAAVVLLPGYFVLPALVDSGVDLAASVSGLVEQLMMAGVVLVASRELVEPRRRERLTAFVLVSASISGCVALAQREGLVGPLGRDIWGRSWTATGSLRGAGLLSDPNFLAVLLAAVVPLAVTWKRGRLRPFVLLALAVGLYATDSRAGLLLAVVALVATLVVHRHTWRSSSRQRGRRVVLVVGVVLIGSLAFDIGGQRERIVDGVGVVLGATERGSVSADAAAQTSAADRRDFLAAWARLGVDRFPFGAGVNAQDFIVTESGKRNAAHNNFAQAVGQGGVFGLGICVLTAACFVHLVRRRSDPFALTGAVVVLGGLFLSYPGSLLFLLPLGLADGIRATERSKSDDAGPIDNAEGRPPGGRAPFAGTRAVRNRC